MEIFERSLRSGVVLGGMLALAAAALLRSAPAPAVDGSDLPPPVVAAIGSDQSALVNVENTLEEGRFVAWTSSVGLQTCLHIAIATGGDASDLREASSWEVAVGSVCGPADVRPTDSLTLIRSVADQENGYGVVAMLRGGDIEEVDRSLEAVPSPSRIAAASGVAVLVYEGTDWEEAASLGTIDVNCECGSLTIDPGFGEE